MGVKDMRGEIRIPYTPDEQGDRERKQGIVDDVCTAAINDMLDVTLAEESAFVVKFENIEKGQLEKYCDLSIPIKKILKFTDIEKLTPAEEAILARESKRTFSVKYDEGCEDVLYRKS